MKFQTTEEAQAFWDATSAGEADNTPNVGVEPDRVMAAAEMLGKLASLTGWIAKRQKAQETAAAVTKPPAAKTEEKAVWREIDTASLSEPLKKQYDAMKAVQRQAAAARDAFEKALKASIKALPAGKEIVFGYRFGKLSFAIVDAKTNKSSKGAVSLSEIF